MARPDLVTDPAACRSCGLISPFIAANDGILRCAACNRSVVDPGGPPLPGSVVTDGEEFEEVVPGGRMGPSRAYMSTMAEAGWTKVSAEHLPYHCWHYHWRFDPSTAKRGERIDAGIGLFSILLVVGALIFGVSSLSSPSASGSRSGPAQSRHHQSVSTALKPLPPRASD